MISGASRAAQSEQRDEVGEKATSKLPTDRLVPAGEMTQTPFLRLSSGESPPKFKNAESVRRMLMLDRALQYLRGVRLTRRSLVKMALTIFSGFVVLSLVAPLLSSPSLDEEDLLLSYLFQGFSVGESVLVEHLRENPDDADRWILLAKFRGRLVGMIAQAQSGMPEQFTTDGVPVPQFDRHAERFQPYLSDAEFRQFLAECAVVPIEILQAWHDAARPSLALSRLKPLGDSTAAILTAAEIQLADKMNSEALVNFDRVLEREPDHSEAMRGRLRILLRMGRLEDLSWELSRPEVRDVADPRLVFEYHRKQGEYLQALPPLWRSEYSHWTKGIWISCLMIGFGWAVLCVHMGFGWQWRRTIQALIPVAMLLGWLSADVTLGAVIVVDDWLGAGGGGSLAWSVLDALLIGVREELIKLIFFLPLLPYLLRAGSEVQALVVASLVGLGFAMNENANYYLSSAGGDILGRYLTANFAHMALTGTIGVYLFKAIRRGGDAWREFNETLFKMILLHAAYDFFIIAPQAQGLEILSMVLFIILSQQYLRLFFRLRPRRIHRVSVTRVFVATLASATGVHYFYLATRLGAGEALWQTLGGFLGSAILLFMYFQEFDEHVA